MSEYRREFEAWWNAFWFIIFGSPKSVAYGYWWKKVTLFLAVFFSIYYPFYAIYRSFPYQGAVPPDVPLIKVGAQIIFENKSNVKNHLYARLVMDAGGWMRIEDAAGLDGVREWENKNASRKLYVEGFRLRDGKGAFWPTYIISTDGTELLSKNIQLEQLKGLRDPMNWKMALIFVLSVPLWVISINNMRKIKNLINT